MALSFRSYPSNWPKASRVIKRIAGYQCERCKSAPVHSVHHKGVPLATGDGWRPGRRGDKHDLRRENLAALCFECHDLLDGGALTFYARPRAKGSARKRKHRALGIGTGLVPLRPVRVFPDHWFFIACLHYALLRLSKRRGQSCYRLLDVPVTRIVDSYLVYVD